MESLNLLKFYLCVIDYQVTLVMGVRLEILGQELFSLYTLSPSLKYFVPYFHTPESCHHSICCLVQLSFVDVLIIITVWLSINLFFKKLWELQIINLTKSPQQLWCREKISYIFFSVQTVSLLLCGATANFNSCPIYFSVLQEVSCGALSPSTGLTLAAPWRHNPSLRSTRGTERELLGIIAASISFSASHWSHLPKNVTSQNLFSGPFFTLFWHNSPLSIPRGEWFKITEKIGILQYEAAWRLRAVCSKSLRVSTCCLSDELLHHN